jgi:iron complex outermembrane receptor protein
VARASDWVNYDRLALSEAFVSAERPSRDFVGAGLRQFWTEYSGVTRAHASVGREVMGRFTVSLSGRNLLNRQRGEPDNVTLVPGRMLSLGVGARF